MPPTFRDPSPQELAALQSLTQTNHIGTMPVKFNGQDRYAIIIMHKGPNGPFIQVVGILPNGDDEVISPSGEKSAPAPPMGKPN